MACRMFATLNTGAEMPMLGFGTWQSADEDAVEEALLAGYRHFDTAAVYANEDVVGRRLDSWLTNGDVKREELFIVTKLPPSGNHPETVEKYLKRSLELLKLDYVDMYLVHTPFGCADADDMLQPRGPDGKILWDPTTDHVAIWKEMEAQVEAGRAKAIGLSNFNMRQIQRVLDNCKIKPANLQVELHVYFQQKPLVEFCRKNGIVVTAYSPLGSPGSAAIVPGGEIPSLINNPVVMEVAKKHGVTSSQVLLRFLLQSGIVAIPKSTKQERIIKNIQLWDFELSPEDMAKLEALDRGEAGRIFDFSFLEGAKDHPEYPYPLKK